MPLPYVQNKKHIYAHRAKNIEQYNSYQHDYLRKNIDYKRSNDYDYISKIFLKILY